MDHPNNYSERENELKDTPILKSMPSSDFFNAPDDYFDTLSSHIQDRIQASKNKTYTIPIFRPAVAGFSFALMLLFAALFYFNQQASKNIPQQAESNTPTLDVIIDSGYFLSLDESLLSETLCELQIKSDTTQENAQDLELENYLIQSMNESSLLNEL